MLSLCHKQSDKISSLVYSTDCTKIIFKTKKTYENKAVVDIMTQPTIYCSGRGVILTIRFLCHAPYNPLWANMMLSTKLEVHSALYCRQHTPEPRHVHT